MILTGSINCTSYTYRIMEEAGLKHTVYRQAVRHCKETIQTEELHQSDRLQDRTAVLV